MYIHQPVVTTHTAWKVYTGWRERESWVEEYKLGRETGVGEEKREPDSILSIYIVVNVF